MSAGGLVWRPAVPTDSDAVITAIDAWWPGLRMVHAVCPQLFQHLGDTCIVVERDERLVTLLVGFMSQCLPRAGCTHHAGAHPDDRGAGLGRELYERFARDPRERGRSELFAETGARRRKSIALHLAMGFELTPGDEVVDGVPAHHDVSGHGFDSVQMARALDEVAGG